MIMKNKAHEVNCRIPGWLRREEIMDFELDSVSDLLGGVGFEVFLALGYNFLEVLDDEV